MNKEIISKNLKEENERVKKDIIISFEDYLKFFVGLSSQEEYQKYVSDIEKSKTYSFPDLFSSKMNKKSLKKSIKQNVLYADIETEIEPLATTNSLYLQLYKHLQIYKYKKKLYNNTFYDFDLSKNSNEEENNLKKLFEEIMKTKEEQKNDK